MDWEIFREIKVLFVFEFDFEMDVGYFDDFFNEVDMVKYKEVYDK